jgi:NAD(P)-dependent dehydrogenase (short-subunit alcohol dehydrogenase family)
MQPVEYDIADRTVIVTAGSRGIGKGIVRVLAESGANVMATALTNTYLLALADELRRPPDNHPRRGRHHIRRLGTNHKSSHGRLGPHRRPHQHSWRCQARPAGADA